MMNLNVKLNDGTIGLMKIAIVAGGTGGHIYPALTLAEELEKRGNEIVFFGSIDRMEKDVVPKAGFKFIGLDITSTSGNIFNKVLSVFSMNKAYRKCLKLLKGFDMAIGFGNYISVPVILAAKKLGLKTVIHEQNSFVGKANKMLDTSVDLVIGSYIEDKDQFKNPNTFILGNPQSGKAFNYEKDDNYLSELGLDKNKKTVVIFMGSLGSETITKVMIDFFKLLDGKYQVIYATGSAYYKDVVSKTEKKDYLVIKERIDGIKAMKASDLLVSRAGATTLCEITALGMPAILIPSPYVPNNHQYFNALALVKNDAALMIEEKDLNAISLKEKIDSIINDVDTLNSLANNAKSMANSTVIEDIVEKIEKL